MSKYLGYGQSAYSTPPRPSHAVISNLADYSTTVLQFFGIMLYWPFFKVNCVITNYFKYCQTLTLEQVIYRAPLRLLAVLLYFTAIFATASVVIYSYYWLFLSRGDHILLLLVSMGCFVCLLVFAVLHGFESLTKPNGLHNAEHTHEVELLVFTIFDELIVYTLGSLFITCGITHARDYWSNMVGFNATQGVQYVKDHVILTLQNYVYLAIIGIVTLITLAYCTMLVTYAVRGTGATEAAAVSPSPAASVQPSSGVFALLRTMLLEFIELYLAPLTKFLFIVAVYFTIVAGVVASWHLLVKPRLANDEERRYENIIEYTEFAMNFFTLVYFIEGLPSFVKRLKNVYDYKQRRDLLYHQIRNGLVPTVSMLKLSLPNLPLPPPPLAIEDPNPVPQSTDKREIPQYNGQVLPEELLEQVLLYLDGATISSKCARVCKHWYSFCNREYMWSQFKEIMQKNPEAYTEIYMSEADRVAAEAAAAAPKAKSNQTTQHHKPNPPARVPRRKFIGVGIQNPNFKGHVRSENTNDSAIEKIRASSVSKRREEHHKYTTFFAKLESVRNPLLPSKHSFIESFTWSGYKRILTSKSDKTWSGELQADEERVILDYYRGLTFITELECMETFLPTLPRVLSLPLKLLSIFCIPLHYLVELRDYLCTRLRHGYIFSQSICESKTIRLFNWEQCSDFTLVSLRNFLVLIIAEIVAWPVDAVILFLGVFCLGGTNLFKETMTPYYVSNVRRIMLIIGSIICHMLQVAIVLAPLFLPIRELVTDFVSLASAQYLAPVLSFIDSSFLGSINSLPLVIYWFIFPHLCIFLAYFYLVKCTILLVNWLLVTFSLVRLVVFYAAYWIYFTLAPYGGYSFIKSSNSNIIDPSLIPQWIFNNAIAFYYNILIFVKNLFPMDSQLARLYQPITVYEDVPTSAVSTRWYHYKNEILTVITAVLWAGWFNVLPFVLGLHSLIIICVLCTVGMLQKASRLIKENSYYEGTENSVGYSSTLLLPA